MVGVYSFWTETLARMLAVKLQANLQPGLQIMESSCIE